MQVVKKGYLHGLQVMIRKFGKKGAVAQLIN